MIFFPFISPDSYYSLFYHLYYFFFYIFHILFTNNTNYPTYYILTSFPLLSLSPYPSLISLSFTHHTLSLYMLYIIYNIFIWRWSYPYTITIFSLFRYMLLYSSWLIFIFIVSFLQSVIISPLCMVSCPLFCFLQFFYLHYFHQCASPRLNFLCVNLEAVISNSYMDTKLELITNYMLQCKDYFIDVPIKSTNSGSLWDLYLNYT